MHKFLVVACLLVLPLASAQYNYDDYDFTEVLTDANDHVGFYDVTSLAIAETGDKNLIFRVGQADNTLSEDASGTSRLIIRFTGGSTQKAMGFFPDFSPATQGAGDGAAPDYCDNVSTSTVYCLVSYASASAGKGSTLGEIQLWSYLGTIADQAPDGSAAIDGGLTYTLTGCTLKDQAACPVEEVPPVPEDAQFFANVTESKFTLNQSMGAPFYGIYHYNFSVAALPAFFNYTTEMTAGSVSFTISDAFDELAVIKVESNFTDSLDLDGFEGDWTMSATFDGFVGNASYGMSSPFVMAMDSNETMDGHMDHGNETMDPETESTPALAVPMLAVGLVILARRRR